MISRKEQRREFGGKSQKEWGIGTSLSRGRKILLLLILKEDSLNKTKKKGGEGERKSPEKKRSAYGPTKRDEVRKLIHPGKQKGEKVRKRCRE